MKITSVALSVIVLLFLAGCTTSDTSTQTTARFDPNLTLNVIVNLNTYGAFNELDAQHYMRESIESTFKDSGWAGKIAFHRYPARNIQGQRIELHLSQWAKEPVNTIVCRYIAIAYPPGGESVDLGVFVGRSTEVVATDSQLIDQFKNAAADAHSKLFARVAEMSRTTTPATAMK